MALERSLSWGKLCHFALVIVFLIQTIFPCPAQALAPQSIFDLKEAQKEHASKLERGRQIVAEILEDVRNGYDVRGITEGKGATMTPELAYALGVGLARNLCAKIAGRKPRVLVTGDHRSSTPGLIAELIDGLIKGGVGVDVVYSKEGVSTPAANIVARMKDQDYDGAVQVTASHNLWTRPQPKNGFKVNVKDEEGYLRGLYGEKMADVLMEGIKPEAKVLVPPAHWGRVENTEILPKYFDHFRQRLSKLLQKLNLSEKDLKDVVLVVDSGNAVMGPIAKKIIESLGMTYVGVHDEPRGGVDADVAHPADPNRRSFYEKHLPAIVRRVDQSYKDKRTPKVVLGIALDGDGDRVGITTDDKDHAYLTSPQMEYFFHEMRRQDDPADPVILDIRSAQEAREISPENAGAFAPGWPIMREEMLQTGANVVTEISNHVLMRMFDDPKEDPIDDGLWAGVYAAAQAVKLRKHRSSSMHKTLDRAWYPSLPEELRPKIREEKGGDRFQLRKDIPAAIEQEIDKEFPGARVQQVRPRLEPETVRFQITDEKGQFLAWLLVRVGKSEPTLSIFSQGRDNVAMQKAATILQQVLQRFPFVAQVAVQSTLAKLKENLARVSGPEAKPESPTISPNTLGKLLEKDLYDASRKIGMDSKAQDYHARIKETAENMLEGHPLSHYAGLGRYAFRDVWIVQRFLKFAGEKFDLTQRFLGEESLRELGEKVLHFKGHPYVADLAFAFETFLLNPSRRQSPAPLTYGWEDLKQSQILQQAA